MRILGILPAILALFMVLHPHGWADWRVDLKENRIASALVELRPSAESGDAEAQYALGMLHETGRGASRDYAEAARWYLAAAKQGNADAQHNLGTLYGHGQGVPKDFREAVRWCRRAGKQGHALAQAKVGYMYEKGMGVERDVTQAIRWYLMAARQGVPSAQYNLGLLYLNGKGVPKDDVRAYVWFKRLVDGWGRNFTKSSVRGKARNILARLEKQLTPKSLEAARLEAARPEEG